MPEPIHNLLTEPIFRVRFGGRETCGGDLPSVLEALGAVDDLTFLALQAHQEQALHSFLVQIAAITLHAAGQTEIRHEAERWRTWLRELGSGDEAWSLIVSDLDRPAFFQPPVPERDLGAFRRRFCTPDELDMLVTAKNHEIKMRRARHPGPEHWVYALINLQTISGYLGRGNYGIARMNGGHASRPALGFAPRLDWPARFRRDTRALLDARRSTAETYGYPVDGGLGLLWLEPWDGVSSLSLQRCDPYFIEICRRVRLVLSDDLLFAVGAPSRAARLDSRDSQGDVGDPWIPIHRASGKALTISGRGFHYRLVRDLLFGAEYVPGPALRLREEDGEHPILTATALARGQGETQGLHRLQLRIPRQARRMLRSEKGQEVLGILTKSRIEATELVQRRVLWPALVQLFEGTPDPQGLSNEWVAFHDREVDRLFFERLWGELELSTEERQVAWQRTLLDLAERTLARAIEIAPLPSSRHFRSIANSQGVFRGLARRHVPDALAKLEDGKHAGQQT
jgi:CRISPR system Cascade subunit CasA